MLPARSELLTSIRGRRRARLATADGYLRSAADCLLRGECPSRFFDDVDQSEWSRALREAEQRLVCGTEVLGKVAELEPSDGAILDFEAVITSSRRDRDGDILESSGADVDPQAVLLWQHIPFQPIGRLVRITHRSPRHIKARLSIADTQLGRDAATLATFGALKLSHGFEPLEFEPLPDGGWHIKRFEIFEVSLVSIPSNRDAVLTALSRRKLHSPLIREWAEEMSRARPVQGIGVELPQHKCNACRRADDDASLDDWSRRWLARAAAADVAELPALHEMRSAIDSLIAHIKAD